MSATAFKRDLSDFKTILDFAEVVQSAERLRLLLVLTVVDIRAVGPGVWNGWKRQLLTDLFEAAEEVLRLGHKQSGRERADRRQAGRARRRARLVPRQSSPHIVAAPARNLLGRRARRRARRKCAADRRGAATRSCRSQPRSIRERGATLVTVYAADHPGLFYRIAGAIHVAGGNIIDARIHTTRDGMALDNFLVQDPLGRPFAEAAQLARLKRAIADALANRGKLADRLAPSRCRARAPRRSPSSPTC